MASDLENQQSSVSALEALLFIYGDPINLTKAAKLLSLSSDALNGAVQELKSALAQSGRGVTLVEHEGTIQLTTKPEFGKLLGAILKAEMHESLTPASLETLAIIAYAGPIGRAEIDYIRGVNSSFTLRALLLRGLVDRDTDPARGNAYRYRPSVELLHHLGVTQVTELPEFERFRTLVASLNQSQAAAAAPVAAQSAPDQNS